MLRNKASVLLLSGFALSSAMVHAGTIATTNPNQKQMFANTEPKFEFSIAALALKPSATNLNYVIYNQANAPVQSPMWNEQELRPSYSAAFELGARYHFLGNRDVGVEWTHLKSNTSSSVNAPNTQYFLGPDYEIGPNASVIRNATGKVQFTYDVVNLDVRQSVNFDNHMGVRFFGGLSNGFLNQQVNTTYAGNVLLPPYQGPFLMQQEVTSKFTGTGPRLGFEAHYDADCGLGFMGEAAASLLVGSSQSKTAYNGASRQLLAQFGQTSNYQTIKDQNIIQVVPGFDAKVGLSYKHAFARDTVLILDGGYEAAVYINAINQYLPGSLVAGSGGIETGGVYVATMSHTQSNYSVNGPFVKVRVLF
jgi:hypothetical protein